MVYAQTVAEDTLQPLRYLHGEGDFGQQIEHLLAFVDGFCDEVDVDFCLAARCDSVQQRHVVVLERCVYAVVCLLLCLA